MTGPQKHLKQEAFGRLGILSRTFYSKKCKRVTMFGWNSSHLPVSHIQNYRMKLYHKNIPTHCVWRNLFASDHI